MPRVPTIDQRVRQAGIQGGGVQVSVSEEAFGGGETARQQAQAINSVSRAVAEFKLQNDRKRVEDADTRMVKEKIRIEGEARDRFKGENGLDATNWVESEWAKVSEEVKNGLQNSTQKSAFDRASTKRFLPLKASMERYGAQEYDKYDSESTNSRLSNLQNEAAINYLDPDSIGQSVTDQVTTIEAYAARTGKSKEWTEEAKRKSVSGTHSSVIKRMVDNKEDQIAKAYLEQVKERGELSANDLQRLEGMVGESSLRGESQRQTEMIMAEHSNLTEALSAARNISNPEVQDQTVKRLKVRFTEQKMAQEQFRERDYESAALVIEDTGSIDNIPVDQWRSFTAAERSKLRRIQANKVSGRENVTDNKTYEMLATMATVEPDKFKRRNILAMDGDKLSPQHQRKFIDLREKMRSGSGKDRKDVGKFGTDQQIISAAIQELQIKDSKDKGLFRRRVSEEIEAWEIANKREASRDEVRKIVDFMGSEVTIDGLIWNSDIKAYKFDPNVDTLVIDDEAREAIVESFKVKGIDPTESQIRGAFMIHKKQGSNDI